MVPAKIQTIDGKHFTINVKLELVSILRIDGHMMVAVCYIKTKQIPQSCSKNVPKLPHILILYQQITKTMINGLVVIYHIVLTLHLFRDDKHFAHKALSNM